MVRKWYSTIEVGEGASVEYHLCRHSGSVTSDAGSTGTSGSGNRCRVEEVGEVCSPQPHPSFYPGGNGTPRRHGHRGTRVLKEVARCIAIQH